MKNFCAFLFFIFNIGFSQQTPPVKKSLVKTAEQKAKDAAKKAPIALYKIISLQRDTVQVDTVLSIKKEYEFNYLRKDIFGLMPFSNEGQTYNTLNFGLTKCTKYPEFGYTAKHFNFLRYDDIKYYSVPTAYTELYYKSVMEQGQNVEALISVNTSKQFNFTVAFKGLRSVGKYQNQLSSSGNFRFIGSYFTKNKRYFVNFHYTGQDILNNENGGITTASQFESGDTSFSDRARVEVYLSDAFTLLKGKRLFFDQQFQINTKNSENNLFITHQFNYETKFFNFNQASPQKALLSGNNIRFGLLRKPFAPINNQNQYQKLYNKVGLVYENKTIGKFQFFAENFNFSSTFDGSLVIDTNPISGALRNSINSIGGQYEYQKNKWTGTFILSNAITSQSVREATAQLKYDFNSKNSISFQFQNLSKLPNHTAQLHQSDYKLYNWENNFKNELVTNFSAIAKTIYGSAELQVTNLNDYIFYQDDSLDPNIQYVFPKQYSKPINYLSLKLAKEVKFRNFSLDNTFLYQTVNQSNQILNVPQFTTRNSLYYSNYYFERALFGQVGLTLNYFSNYYANNYNPVIGEFFIQKTKQIGNFPRLDFFINARIRQTHLFLKGENINEFFSKKNYYSAPNVPFTDFIIRAGVVWDFFQ